jgi:hypothetical protein
MEVPCHESGFELISWQVFSIALGSLGRGQRFQTIISSTFTPQLR